MATSSQPPPKPADPCGPRPDIPTNPLWHMGLAHKSVDSSFKLLQSSVDWLTCQGKRHQTFDKTSKEFMHDLFEAFSAGGWWNDWPEASQLADHYVNGKGASISINAAVYSTSVIVRDTQAAMKQFLADTRKPGGKPRTLLSTTPTFAHSSYTKVLRSAARDQNTHGQMLANGGLLAEQNNKRLKNADNRFVLESFTQEVQQGKFNTLWSINSRYDFEPFSVGHVTHIPLGSNILKVPDGLSEYLTHTHINVAQAFNYSARWNETWNK